ncbi:MAG: cytidine/deoxycytidylate deaminase family protein [Puniceicoccales bacterium]|jgi:dCMP deaminase|nr:cytidine/deoxycytidylate deaminase family protein [Puniceicoccales bacterium]
MTAPSSNARESWDDYFMKLTRLVASRSTCLRRRIGALLVREHRLLATGYNGAPSGLPHCLDVGCLRQQRKVPSGERSELCRAVHAEQNTLLQCARFGLSTEGATLYCTHFPCAHCAKSLLSAKVCRIVYEEEYRDELAQELLDQAQGKITVESWKSSRGFTEIST